jgi:hypothetical protein
MRDLLDWCLSTCVGPTLAFVFLAVDLKNLD